MAWKIWIGCKSSLEICTAFECFSLRRKEHRWQFNLIAQSIFATERGTQGAAVV